MLKGMFLRTVLCFVIFCQLVKIYLMLLVIGVFEYPFCRSEFQDGRSLQTALEEVEEKLQIRQSEDNQRKHMSSSTESYCNKLAALVSDLFQISLLELMFDVNSLEPCGGKRLSL